MLKRLVMPALFLAGIALATVLAVRAGVAPTLQALQAIGWSGLGLVCLLQLLSLAICAAAWWVVADGASLIACCAARWIRDGGSNLVGFIPAVGEGISARALTVFGSSAGGAAAATIVDVAVEALAQAIYTVAAFVLLWPHLNIAQTPQWTLIVALSVVPVLAMFAVTRHAGALAMAQRIGLRLAAVVGFKGGEGGFNLAEAVQGIYRRRGRIAAAFGLHLAAWVFGAAQVWVAARAMPHPIGFSDAIALAGLVAAARSAFFLVPWAAGVQEGGFLLVGAALGVDPASAIALSLIWRARDVVVGAPAILLWYVAEGRRSLRRRADAKA